MDNKGLNPITDFKLIKNITTIYYDLNPDLILHYTIKPVIYGSFSASKLGIPFINNITGMGTAFIKTNWLTFLVKFLYRLSQKNADHIIFQNVDDKNYFINKKLIPIYVPSDIIPGTGVDTGYFDIHPYPKSNSLTFLLVARILWDKGVGEFVHAARKVKAEFPDARFQLLGFLDVNNRTSIPRMDVCKWIDEDIIDYLGDTDDVRPYIKRAGCIVLPSYREGLPKSLLEAASMGRPIIATDVTGCREIVANGKNGFLCDVKDYQSLAEKIKTFIELPLEAKEKMGLEGRNIVEKRFDEKNVVPLIFSKIEKLLLTKSKK